MEEARVNGWFPWVGGHLSPEESVESFTDL